MKKEMDGWMDGWIDAGVDGERERDSPAQSEGKNNEPKAPASTPDVPTTVVPIHEERQPIIPVAVLHQRVGTEPRSTQHSRGRVSNHSLAMEIQHEPQTRAGVLNHMRGW